MTGKLRECAGVLLVVLVSLAGAAPELTARVDVAAGAPRLVVRGEPVRSRMFWGAPGSSPIPIDHEWKEVRFDFTASASATNGSMHIRFGQTPGEVWLDDIRVSPLEGATDLVRNTDFEAGIAGFERDWTYWPIGAGNTVGTIEVKPGAGQNHSAALHVALHAPKEGGWPDFHIYHRPKLAITKGQRYRVTFWAKAAQPRNLTVAFYRPGESFVHLGGPADSFQTQIKLAAAAGIRFVSFPIDLPWPAPGKPADWSGADAQCEAVLSANPDALLVPRMWMGPPTWWRDAHPDDVMQWENGHRDQVVVASPAYRRDAAERLAALVEHLEAKFGNHVAGYHPSGQNTGEWFYYDTWKSPLNGYAPADRAGWHVWLKGHYSNDNALRKAWNDPAVTCETAAVPTPAARHASPAGTFRDPKTEQSLIDWAEFQQDAMADCVCALATAVRKASHGRKLVLFFYGYGFEFGPITNGPATSGHYGLRRVLNSPDIDILCSPISYFDRGLGQSAPAMSAAESVALAGKLWLAEDDTSTFLASEPFPGFSDHVKTVEATVTQLERNVAQEALRNFGTWWMDLGASGWFNDARLWAAMKRMNALDEPLLKTPTPFRPEVAAVIDESSMLRVTADGSRVTRPSVYEARLALGRMGAPYGQYLLDDVTAGRVAAKMYVLLNAWSLNAAQRETLLRSTRGAVRVWCYAPGYFDEAHASPEAMHQLTGFRLKAVKPAKGTATPTELGRKLGMRQSFGGDAPVSPLFAAEDAKADEILATYADGSAAVALRKGAEGTSVFVGPPGLTSELLRIAAKGGKVHLFTDVDCNVYANGPFLAVHASQDGPLKIHVGKRGATHDLFSGTVVGTTPDFSLNVKRGETRIFRLGDRP